GRGARRGAGPAVTGRAARLAVATAVHAGRRGARSVHQRIGEPERADQLAHPLRLAAQLLGRAGALLGARGRLLRDRVHLLDGHVDLAHPLVLLVARGRDLGHDLADAPDLIGDLLEVREDLGVQRDAVLDVLDALLDELRRVPRRVRAPHREVADLLGDDREALAGFTGPRR